MVAKWVKPKGGKLYFHSDDKTLFDPLGIRQKMKDKLDDKDFLIWDDTRSLIDTCHSAKMLPIYAKTSEIGVRKAKERSQIYLKRFEDFIKKYKTQLQKIRKLLDEKYLFEFDKLYSKYKEGKSLVPAFVIIDSNDKT